MNTKILVSIVFFFMIIAAGIEILPQIRNACLHLQCTAPHGLNDF